MDVVECRRCGRSRPAPSGTLGDSCPYCLLMFAFGEDDLTGDDAEGAPATMPERVGPYRLVELLGAGGMGSVYRAEHEALGRTVALKVLRPEFAARAGFRERFQREGRVLASLTHPNIVGIHDTGCDDGIYYLAMEYVAGSTLRERLNAGPLTVDEALAIFGALADALHYAHQRGIVHRDIKPENVLLDDHRRAKLADFGVAKLVDASNDERIAATEFGAVVGTRRYMAPEQLEPGRAIDHRADLYALAAVTYEMLTGEAPLGAFAPPSRIANVDPRLDAPLMAALAKDPKARPGDALAFTSEVMTALDMRDEVGEATLSRKRRRRFLQLAAATMVITAAAAIARRFGAAPQPDELAARWGARRLVHPAGVWRGVFAPDGNTLATACGDRMVRFWPVAGGEPSAAFMAYPHGELGYLALAYSPDGNSLATAGGENVARVWDVVTHAERFALKQHSREIVDVAWSSDGKLIATAGHDKAVRLWNAADGTLAHAFAALPDPALCVSFSPDGALLAAGIMNGSIQVWDVATHELRSTLGHQKRVWSVAFAPSSMPDSVPRMASGSHDQSVKLWTLLPKSTTKKPPPAIEIKAGGEVWSLAVSPRGDLLAAGLNDGTLRLWSFPDGRELRTVREHTASIVGVAFSPDGAQLATSSLDGSAILWDMARLSA